MRAWKIISGILSILLFGIIVIQSSAAGLVNALEGEGGISGSVGIVCGVLILTGGILSLASNNAKGKGANIALVVIFGLAGVIGITLHDNYADLVIWSIWALLNALIALIAAIVKKKVDPVIVAGDKEKNFAEQTANKVSTELIEGPVVHCSVNFNDPELEAPIKRMASLLREQQWKEADACCERMLDQDYEAALPYVGKLMVERQVNVPSHLSWCAQPLESSQHYRNALKYADDELKDFLETCNTKIVQRQQDEVTERRYQDCLTSMKQAEKSIELEKIAGQLVDLGDYKDAKEKAEECRKALEICKSKENTRRHTRKVVLRIFGFVICLPLIILLCCFLIQRIPAVRESYALDLIEEGEYDEAYKILSEIGREEKITENKKERANILIRNRVYSSAFLLLAEIGDYETIYHIVMEAVENGEYSKVASAYKPYEQQVIGVADVGTLVVFGNDYYDEKTSSNYLRKWIVLEKDEGRVLLLSEKAVAMRPFDSSNENHDWKDCSLNSWLNSSGFLSYFSQEEIDSILVTSYNSGSYKVSSRVFLLSSSEVEQYSKIPELMDIWQCTPAETVKKSDGISSEGTCRWWLRTKIAATNSGAYVDYDGNVSYSVIYLKDHNVGVRPALWVSVP